MYAIRSYYGYKEDLTKEIPEVDKFYGKFDFKEIIKDLNATFYEQKMYHRVQTTPAHFAYLKSYNFV